MEKLYLGVARENITPEIGCQLYGYNPNIHSTCVNDDLTLTAFYFKEGNKQALLMTATVCLIKTEYANEMYGTPASEIEKIFDEGKIPLLILDLNGVRSLKGAALGYGVFSVYLTAEESVLNERLYERARAEGLTKTALNKFERRKEQNRLDKETVKSTPNLFDAVIENTTVEKTAEDIISKFLK